MHAGNKKVYVRFLLPQNPQTLGAHQPNLARALSVFHSPSKSIPMAPVHAAAAESAKRTGEDPLVRKFHQRLQGMEQDGSIVISNLNLPEIVPIGIRAAATDAHQGSDLGNTGFIWIKLGIKIPTKFLSSASFILK